MKATRTLEELGFSECAVLSLAIVSREEMRRLNGQYRGIDRPTNVLSFSQREGDVVGDTDHALLGDVVICADVARDQANELGYTLQEMVTYLMIHGIMHLRGQHHNDVTQERIMSERVNELFETFYPYKQVF